MWVYLCKFHMLVSRLYRSSWMYTITVLIDCVVCRVLIIHLFCKFGKEWKIQFSCFHLHSFRILELLFTSHVSFVMTQMMASLWKGCILAIMTFVLIPGTIQGPMAVVSCILPRPSGMKNVSQWASCTMKSTRKQVNVPQSLPCQTFSFMRTKVV